MAFVERVAAALTHRDILGVMGVKKSEDKLKTFMYGALLRELRRLHSELSPGVAESRIERKAQHSVVWEGDVSRTIHHQMFLGVQHRPDFEVLLPNTSIAVEVKLVGAGQGVREGLGQALVYSRKYDFVILLAIDVTRSGSFKESLLQESERVFIDSLWDLHNIRVAVP